MRQQEAVNLFEALQDLVSRLLQVSIAHLHHLADILLHLRPQVREVGIRQRAALGYL